MPKGVRVFFTTVSRRREIPAGVPEQVQDVQLQSRHQGLQQGDVRESGSPLPF